MTRRLLFAVALLFIAFPGRAGEVDLASVVQGLLVKGDALVARYDAASGAAVSDGFSDLYFDVFEGSGMEEAIGSASPTAKSELEAMFADIIGKTARGRSRSDVEAAWSHLKVRLTAVASRQANADTGALATFLQSFLILLREGFEAMLVVAALVAYLRRVGQSDKAAVVWQGVAWALAASLATAWLLAGVLRISGRFKEALEGALMLAAAGVLFYVSFWLLSKREAASWQRYIRSQVQAASASGRQWSLALAAFLAVFREGAETVLFYQALALAVPSQMPALVVGMAVAAATLALVYLAMRSLSLRLPLGLFFAATAALLFFLSFTFGGKGMLELQEGGVMSITPIDWLPRVEWLGLFPTLESAGVQLALIVPMIGGLLWLGLRRRATRAR